MGNRDSDDALNIIRSEFIINRSVFSQTYADAFDADYSKGNITNSQFFNCGNDGIDVSGTRAAIENVFINQAGDKGISVGENSHVEVRDVEIRKAKIAVAAKDISRIDFTNNIIADCATGIAVYQKKPEFGPAEINITKLDSRNVAQVYLVEEDSSLTIDGISLKGDQKDVYKKLYPDDEE
jgi:hypothetical protein